MGRLRWIFLLLAAASLRAAADPPPDPSCGLNTIGIKTDSTLTRDQASLVYNDLMYLKGMKFSSQGPLLQKYFGLTGSPDEAGPKIFDWVKARTTQLGRRAVVQAYAANLGHASRAGSVSDNYPYGYIVLTDEFFTVSSRIKRLEVYLHEARHSDGDKYIADGKIDANHPNTSHGFCRTASTSPQPRGTLADNGCDPNILGAYGYQAIFLNNVSAACANCTEDEKNEAKALGRSALFNHHLEIPEPFPPPR
jgi:hypothetical protein